MLDIKVFREDIDRVKAALKVRGKEFDVSIITDLDSRRRDLIARADEMKQRQNKVSKEIPKYKKEGRDTAPIFAEMKELSDEIKKLDDEIRDCEAKLQEALYEIPNIPSPLVPPGRDSSENLEIRKSDVPVRVFDFEPKAHWDIGTDLGLFDAEVAAKISGARFTVYSGLGARLERAVINFFMDTHAMKQGYKEIFPPFIVNGDSMLGTGQLPKFAEDMFKLENLNYYLIPTAEVPVTNLHRSEILSGADLPIRYCAYSACFRAEAGSAGRDTRGLIRQHQFNKVELVHFVKPETSYEALEQLTNDAAEMLDILKLPYRVVRLCAGDLGFSSAMTYDIEVFMPSYKNYVEISSCSNFEDFQARRAAIRYKDSPKDKAKLVHTLNGSGLAVGRTVAAILENYQNADGSVTVPEALVPYMGGVTVIK
ncbi:MAG: serine--tRNA ligase [Clostridia bacterium]|nr:serine--tRNA ligase [Clostridia bacterium]